MLTIYHNPRCRKSRETLELIKNKGLAPKIIEYLNEPPSESEMKDILSKLDIQPEELLRKTESIYNDQFKGKDLSGDEWIKVMTENPKLIERPIVINKGKAVIGRPPENVLSII